MAFRNISVVITGNAAPYQAALAQASAQTHAFSSSINNAGNAAATSGKLFAAMGAVVGTALVAGFAAAVRGAVQFEAVMRNVSTISVDARKDFEGSAQGVLNLSKVLPQSAKTLAEGLYDIASSGFQGAEGMKVLKASAEAASAGLSTTSTSARAITAVLNAYGLSADSAAQVSDVLFETVNVGVVTFEEFAQNLGDFVGMAAALRVPIQDAAAAFAVMTLNGINAAEAATSLNRVMQSFLQPTEAMTKTMHDLGYESASAAVAQDGLRTVMIRLREETGGSAVAMTELFDDVRSLRGALALLNDGGEKWNEVAAKIENQTQVLGATKRALTEQMKGLGMQFQLAMNNVQAFGIELGMKLLPVLMGVLDGAKKLGSELVDRLRPYFESMVNAGQNVWQIMSQLATTFGPLLTAIAGLIGLPVLAWLTGWANALEGVTGFLAEHEGVVRVLAGLYVASLVPGIARAVAAFASLKADQIANAMWNVAGSVDGAAKSFNGWKTVMSGLALAGFVVVITSVISAMQDATTHADRMSEAFRENFDTGTVSGLNDYIAGLHRMRDELYDTGKVQNGFMNTLKATADLLPFVDTGTRKTAETYAQYGRDIEEAARKQINFNDNLAALSRETGLSTAEVEAFAQKIGVDLTKAYGDSGPAREEFISRLKGLGEMANLAMEDINKLAGGSIEAFIEIAKAASEAGKKAGEAFTSQTSLVAAFGDQTKVTGAQIADFYKNTVSNAETFANGINTLMQKGLDPSIVAQLLQAGPEKATPIIQGILSGNTSKLIGIMEEGQRRLDEINRLVVEQARMMNLAVNAQTDDLANNLKFAMAAVQLEFQKGGAAQWNALLKEYGIGRDQAVDILSDFGSNKARTALENAVPVVGAAADKVVGAITTAFGHLTAPGGPHERSQEVMSLFNGYIAQGVPETDAKARAVSDALRIPIDKLPAWADQTGGDVAKNWTGNGGDGEGGGGGGISSMPGDTATVADNTSRALHEKLDPLPGAVGGLAGLLANNWRIGTSPVPPETLTTFNTTANNVRTPLTPVPGQVGGLAGQLHNLWFGGINPIPGGTQGVMGATAQNTTGPISGTPAAVGGTAGSVKGAWLGPLGETGSATYGAVSTWAKNTAGPLSSLLTAIGQGAIALNLPPPQDMSPYAIRQARGGLVDYFANGSENHIAQIAPAGAMRLWAEPETGGEAYIPLALSKRQRSMQILVDVARRFGADVHEYAEGGIPPIPNLSAYGIAHGHTGTQELQYTYDRVKKWYDENQAPALGPGIGWQKMWEALKQKFPWAALHSAYRPGAITATGNPSYHGMGRAIDVSPSSEIGNWIRQNYMAATREMIYTPMGSMQIHNGSNHVYSGITAAMHYDHLHWAMKHGGLLDFVKKYDKGGILDPGVTLAYNGTGRPEYIVPAAEGYVSTKWGLGGHSDQAKSDARARAALRASGITPTPETHPGLYDERRGTDPQTPRWVDRPITRSGGGSSTAVAVAPGAVSQSITIHAGEGAPVRRIEQAVGRSTERAMEQLVRRLLSEMRKR